MITLTKDEADALANHLEWYIIQEVKDDEDYDNIQYLAALIHVYERCKEVSEPLKKATANIEANFPPDQWEQLKREFGIDTMCEVKP